MARSRIQTALADRNVATVGRREEGKAVCRKIIAKMNVAEGMRGWGLK